MTNAERKRVVNALTTKIIETGTMKLNQVSPTLQKAGIDRAIYGGVGPKMWLKENFEEFVVEGSNGLETVRLAQDGKLAAALQMISAILTERLESEGSILFSNVPSTLEKYGIDYKEYSEGKGLKAWLIATFPEFDESENGLSLILTEIPNSEEVRQMHSMAFMNWWSANVKQLRQFGGFTDVSENDIRDQVAVQMATGLLTGGNILLDATMDPEPRIAFDTGLLTENKDKIYCVLEVNPINEDKTKPFWRMRGFCYPGEDSENGLGKWLQERFDLSSSYAPKLNYTDLEDQLEVIETARETLLPQLTQYAARLEAGVMPDGALSIRVVEYEKAWETFKTMLQAFALPEMTGETTLDGLKQLIGGRSAVLEQRMQAIAMFDSLTEGVKGLYDEYHLANGENATPQKDRLAVHTQYDTGAEQVDFEPFLERLRAYRSLLTVMSAKNWSDEVDKEIERVCNHFPEVSYRFATRMLIGADEQEWKFLTAVDGITEQVMRCAAAGSSGKETEDISGTLDPDALLTESVNGGDDWPIRWLRHAQRALPREKSEQALVLGDLKGAAELDSTLDISAVKNLTTELTPFGAGTRLLALQGNRNRSAEGYFLLGLLYDPERCIPALLRLYREERRDREFETLWVRYSDNIQCSSEDMFHWFRLQCDTSPEDALQLAEVNLSLQYQADYLRLLIPAAERVGDTEKAEAFARRLDKLENAPQPNEFEKLLIAANVSAINSYISQRDALSALGYTADEISRISKAAEAGDYPRGRGDYETGQRIYLFQRNKNQMSERYFWKGLPDGWSSRCVQLLLLLTQERRWSESVGLYERYGDALSKDANCRKLYLIARLNLDADSVRQYIRDNLQDCLLLMTEIPNVISTIESRTEHPEYGDFYTGILKISTLLEDPFLKSVMLLDRSLRENAFNQDLLVRMAFDAQRIETIGSLYKNDNYPHGTDAVSMAERVFRFAGVYKDAAEQIARFAQMDDRIAKLLWSIYTINGDEPELFTLLQSSPVLRSEHRSEYLRMLYRKENYAEFLQELAAAKAAEPDIQLQQVIAQLKLGMGLPEPLPDLAALSAEEDASLCAAVIGILAASDHLDVAEQMLFANFEGWITRYPADTLTQLVTGAGSFSAEMMADVQTDALKQECVPLAIYYYTQLQIGDLKAQAEVYYQQVQSAMQQISGTARLQQLQLLQLLYGQESGGLDAQMISLSISQLLDSGMDPKETAKEIHAVLMKMNAVPETVEEVYALLTGSDLCYNYLIYALLSKLSIAVGLEEKNLRFFHAAGQAPLAEAKPFFQAHLCQLYLNALSQGYFPEEFGPEAEKLCYHLMGASQNVSAILCIYYLELGAGRKHRAYAILRYLMTLPQETLGEENTGRLTEIVSELWKEDVPSIPELFRDMLSQASLEEIRDYLSFCGKFHTPEPGTLIRIRNIVDSDQVFTEADSDAALKLLFSEPGNPDYWSICSHIPLDSDPVGYAKFLYLYSEKQPSCWKECVQLCEKHKVEDLLIKALTGWAKTTGQSAEDCRKYLEQQIEEDSAYLHRWQDAQEILTLVQSLCSQLPPGGDVFTQLKAVSLIAVKTGRPECLDMLREQAGSHLFGTYCDLGVVVLCHLMLDGRIEEATQWLSTLNRVVVNMKYRELVRELSRLTPERFRQWHENEENRMFLQLVLPDGNQPNLRQINRITYDGMMQEKQVETARVLLRLLKMFPDDYGTYNALFDLCTTRFEGYLPLLHRSLMGLVRLPGNSDFYRRTQTDYAIMLGALNVVLIIQRRTKEIDDGYNFGERAGDYFRQSCGALITAEQASAVNAAQDKVLSDLRNRSGEDLSKRCEAYLSCITGNWTEFLRDAWRERDLCRELNLYLGEEADKFGFARSLLQLMLPMDQQESRAFLKWVKESLQIPNRLTQREFVRCLRDYGHLDALRDQKEYPLEELLRFPFEDYSLYSLYTSKVLCPAIENNPQYLRSLIWLTSSLACHRNVMTDLNRRAYIAFQDGNDETAAAIYFGMHRTAVQFGLVHKNLSKGGMSDNSLSYQIRGTEEYETRYRIASLFAGNEGVMKKVGAADYRVWSTINLVVSLMATPRADEVLRLKQYLAPSRAELADKVFVIMSPTAQDAEKLAVVTATNDDVERGYLAYLLKYPYVSTAKEPKPSWRLESIENAQIAERLYFRSVKQMEKIDRRSVKGGTRLAHCVLLYPKVNPKTATQKDPAKWWEPKKVLAVEEQWDFVPLSFVRELIPIEDGTEEELNACLQQHKELMQLKLRESFQQRQSLSEEVYRRTVGLDLDSARRYEAMALYGVDRYYVLYTSGTAAEKAQANAIIKELLSANGNGAASGDGYTALAELVRTLAFSELIKSYPTIKEMVEDYSRNRVVFHHMRRMFTDNVLIRSITCLYEVLENLSESYAVYSSANSEPLHLALTEGYRQLSTIEANGWMELKNRLQRLINDEINALNQKPELVITLLNQGLQPEQGYFSGLVANRGMEAAENVILQASYGESGRSRQYQVNRMEPGAEVVFEIRYSVAPGVVEMPFHLDIAYTYRGKTTAARPLMGSFEIGQIEEPVLPFNPYSTDGSVAFTTNPETGEVYSPNFFGRRDEKAKLEALVEGDFFPDYHSAIVYGVRRTGKTSLLNYFCEYVSANRKNAICVKVDVQLSKYTVQNVFVDKVLESIYLPELKNSENWKQFVTEWKTLPDGASDRDPNTLKQFYLELKQITGKGLILIIDEIDRLFQRLTENQQEDGANLDNGLFSALSSLLDDNQCASAVHFVMCGSNWLIRYSSMGYNLQQMFQRFGDNKIEVGRLPERDVRDLLLSAYTRYPQVRYTDKSLNMIWEYTGGLVWFTKLLGNAVIRRAREMGRGTIYPYDVFVMLPEILSEGNCRQFYEGCNAGSPEWRLIDAMQSLANKRDMYISVDQLCTLLDCNPDEVEQSLRILTLFKIVERHPVNPTTYRFGLDIYRRYFRTTSSAFERLPEEKAVFEEKREDHNAGITTAAAAEDADDEFMTQPVVEEDDESWF